MKSLLIASLFLIFPAVSFASHIPGHPSQENGDPQQVVQSWGLTGAQTPKVAPGTVVKDEAGNTSICEKWMSSGCSDVSRTEWYRNQMIALGRQLKANGWIVAFPQFQYWANLAN